MMNRQDAHAAGAQMKLPTELGQRGRLVNRRVMQVKPLPGMAPGLGDRPLPFVRSHAHHLPGASAMDWPRRPGRIPTAWIVTPYLTADRRGRQHRYVSRFLAITIRWIWLVPS
jgi:hypothetical protein